MTSEQFADWNELQKLIGDRALVCKQLGLGIPNCRGLMYSDDVHWYPHEGGIEIPGEKGKQWVYLRCPKCHYEASWWKVIRRLKRAV